MVVWEEETGVISDEGDLIADRTLKDPRPGAEDDILIGHTVLFLASLSQLKRVRVRNEVNVAIRSTMFKSVNHKKLQFL